MAPASWQRYEYLGKSSKSNKKLLGTSATLIDRCLTSNKKLLGTSAVVVLAETKRRRLRTHCVDTFSNSLSVLHRLVELHHLNKSDKLDLFSELL